MRRRSLFAALTALALPGCSPPATDYRLAAVEGPTVGQAPGGQALAGQALAGQAPIVAVRSVSVPGYLEQDGIGKPGAPYQFSSYPNDIWADSLADQLQGVMVQELTERLPGLTVLPDNGAIGAPAILVVEMNVLRFDPDASGDVILDVQIAVRRGRDNKLWRTVDFMRQAPAGAGPAGIVAAMSALWAQAADQTAVLLAETAASG